MISAPDKRFTFDKNRAITQFEHLLQEYRAGVDSVTDDHYLDFVLGSEPGLDLQARQLVEARIDSARKRREHAHVWDSGSFKEFVRKTLKLLDIDAVCLFESAGETNHFEYFSVWCKGRACSTRMLSPLSSATKWLSRLWKRTPNRPQYQVISIRPRELATGSFLFGECGCVEEDDQVGLLPIRF